MYITRDMKGHIADVLRKWPERDVRFICVSTGGRILGLGDIGANGMGIPIGKLQLYTACAAVPPHSLLPVLFDIGTSNAALRADPLYLGLRQVPPSEQELDELVEEFIQAVQQVFPGCCVHFEDWKGTDAIRLLDRYKDKVLCCIQVIGEDNAVAFAGSQGNFEPNAMRRSSSTTSCAPPGCSATPARSFGTSRWRGRGSIARASTRCSAARSCW
jgi:malate dehydrogenase (oxaloacetate-decarboxylating)(NADP+)